MCRLTRFAACCLIGAGTAHAQTSPTEPPAITERVEVVATRIPESPDDVPAAIEVLTGDDLRSLGASTLSEALSVAAGVDVYAGGDAGPAGSVPEFWGLREFDAFLLVVDNVPWGGAFNPALTSLSLRDVERVEVLRGAAPVTFGATSFVGVIHVVHKAAAVSRSAASAQVGSHRSGGGAIDVSLPTLNGWQSRLSADGDRQGFSDPRTSFARGHVLYRGARGALGTPGAPTTAPGARLWVTADLLWLGQDPASPHPREGARLSTRIPVDANHNPAGAFLDETRMSAAFGAERPAGRGTVGLTGSFTHSAQRQFRGFLTELSSAGDNAAGFREDIDVNDVYVDGHVTVPAWRRIRVTGGGDLLFGNGEGRGAAFTYAAPLDGRTATIVSEPTRFDRDAESRRTFVGAYALAEADPTASLRLTAGLRLNATRERRGEGEAVDHVRPSGMLGAIATVWRRDRNHVKVFADYRSTFKPAAFDFSLVENEGVLEPETATSGEGGVKVRAAGGRLDLEASAFRLDFSNLVTATVVGGLPAFVNAGTTRFQGLDLAASVMGPRHVSARASYGFHDARFVDFVQAFDGVPTQLGGRRFEMSARHRLSAAAVLAPERGVVADVVARFTGDRFLNKRNTALASPFTTLDAGLGFRGAAVEIRLDGRNLTDRRDAAAESEFGDAQYYRLASRSLRISTAVRF